MIFSLQREAVDELNSRTSARIQQFAIQYHWNSSFLYQFDKSSVTNQSSKAYLEFFFNTIQIVDFKIFIP